MATKDKDYRLVTLISDICPLPLRKFFLNLAQSDTSPGVPFTTLDTYMTFRKPDVTKLKSIQKYQFNLIYPKADETKWDVSLLSALLIGLFLSQMKNGEDQLIKIIREIRNKRQHKPGNVVTGDIEFDTVWNDIETAALTLAQIIGGTTYEDEIRTLINDVKVNNLPRLGDTLKSWYEDIIVQLRNDNEELKGTSSRSLGILEATTVKRKSSSGGKTKRQKIDDPVLKKLRGHYEQTLTRVLPEDFEPHEKEGTVRRQLRENHYVVVSGYENTTYLATVLSAIKSSGNYHMSRCAEIKKLDDWRYVDPEETDLVIYCEPFQDRGIIDDPKSRRELCDVFQSMQDSAEMSDKESRVDVVIVSEHSMVESWKEHNDLRLFENVVELYRPTNEESPLDVEKRFKSYTRHGAGDVLENMLAYSDAFIQQNKSDAIDPALFESAKEKFKQHKAVVITGPAGSGKTAFAVSLVSSIYERYQCVILNDASQLDHAKLGDISVIIIDEFAGKFKYSAGLAESWMNRFDLIHAAVSVGKLNVIITCETTRFSKVLKNFTGHPLLNHRIKLPKRGLGIVVKEEPISDNELDIDEQDQEQARDLPDANINTEYSNAEKQEQCLLEGKLVGELKVTEVIQYCCEALNGEIFVIGGGKYLALLETSNFTIIKEITLPYSADCLSCIDEQNVVLFSKEENKLFYASLSKEDIELQNSYPIQVHHKWTHLIRKGSRYVMCTSDVVFIYDLNWKRIGTVSHLNNKPLFVNDRRNFRYGDLSIRDIDVGDSIIVIGSEASIVITDQNGDIIKTSKQGGTNVTMYDERLFFLKKGDRISIVTNNGKVVGMLFNGDLSTYRHWPTSNGCFCYGKKCKKLFYSNSENIKLLSVN